MPQLRSVWRWIIAPSRHVGADPQAIALRPGRDQPFSADQLGPDLPTSATAAADELSIVSERVGSTVWVELMGVLTSATCGRLADGLDQALQAAGRQIVVDLRGLTQLDAAGMSVLLIAHLHASDGHQQLVLIAGPETVQRALNRSQVPFDYMHKRRDKRRTVSGSAR